MSQGPPGPRPASTSPLDDKYRSLAPLQSRTLPPIQNALPAPASQDVFQTTPATQILPSRPTPPSSTPPEQRTSRPIGVQNLLNPASGDASNAQNRRRNPEYFDSPPTPSSIGSTSRAATPSLPPASVKSRSPIDVSLPRLTSPSIGAYPASLGRAMTPRSPSSYAPNLVTTGLPSGTIDARQSPFLATRDQTSTTSGPGLFSLSDMTSGPAFPQRPYVSTLPLAATSPPPRRTSQDSSSHSRAQIPFDLPGSVSGASQSTSSPSDSPSAQYSPFNQVSRSEPAIASSSAPTGQPQSFFSTPLSTSGPGSTISQIAFDSKALDVPTSGATGQTQYQLMTIETDKGRIQVPIDMQGASKVADEKRKRNATASHRFRQRRKEKERETSESIAKLEAQIREIGAEKEFFQSESEFYQAERNFFHDTALRNRIPIPPRPPSPRRRQHAAVAGAPLEEEGNSRAGRNMRRRTSAYVPPQGQVPSSTVEPYDRISSAPSDYTQGGNRLHPQGPFPPHTRPFDPSALR